MKKYPDFFGVLIGDRPGLLFGFIIIACIGAVALMMIEANKRNRESKKSPVKFSIKYWFADNLLRITGTIFLIYLVIRGIYAYIPDTWMLFASIGIGFGSDKLATIAKKMGYLTTNKLASKVSEKLAEKENGKE